MVKSDTAPSTAEEKDERLEMLAQFSDELSAQRYLETILWPNGIECPHCGNRDRIGKLNGSSTRLGAHKCYACRRSFSVTHGTIFRSSHVPIHKWLQAIYLTNGGTRPIKPQQLQRILNVSFKTASSMIGRLSEAAVQRTGSGQRSCEGAAHDGCRAAPGD